MSRVRSFVLATMTTLVLGLGILATVQATSPPRDTTVVEANTITTTKADDSAKASIELTGTGDPTAITIDTDRTDAPKSVLRGKMPGIAKPVSIATPLGQPVSITPDAAEDRGGVVTLAYDPAQLPDATAEERVVLGYYHDEWKQWILIPTSTIDKQAHAVTAQVPHFSWFQTWVVKPGRWLDERLSKAADATIRNTVGVVSGSIGSVPEPSPKLNCNPPTIEFEAVVDAPVDLTEACVTRPKDPNDPNFYLQIRNANMYAIHFKLPRGVSVHDINASISDGTGPYLRQIAAVISGRAVVPGPGILTLKFDPKVVEHPFKIKMLLEPLGIAMDYANVLSSSFGVKSTLTTAEQQGLRQVIRRISQASAGGKALSGRTVNRLVREAFQQAYANAHYLDAVDISSCLTSRAWDSQQPDETIEEAIVNGAKVVRDCMPEMLALQGGNITDFLDDTLDFGPSAAGIIDLYMAYSLKGVSAVMPGDTIDPTVNRITVRQGDLLEILPRANDFPFRVAASEGRRPARDSAAKVDFQGRPFTVLSMPNPDCMFDWKFESSFTGNDPLRYTVNRIYQSLEYPYQPRINAALVRIAPTQVERLRDHFIALSEGSQCSPDVGGEFENAFASSELGGRAFRAHFSYPEYGADVTMLQSREWVLRIACEGDGATCYNPVMSLGQYIARRLDTYLGTKFRFLVGGD